MTRAARLIHIAAWAAALAAAGSAQAAAIEPGVADRPAAETACKRPVQDVLNSATDQTRPAPRATRPMVGDDFKLIFYCPARSEPTT